MDILQGGKKKIIAAILIVFMFFMLLIMMISVVSEQMQAGSGGKVNVENLPDILTQEMVSGAMVTEKKYMVPASLTLAQIILESSGSYPGGLSKLAYECHNLFGMKGIGPAGYAEYATGEQTETGGSYTVTAKFRKYHNVAESIEDHGKLLSSGTYKEYTKGCKTSDEWARAIHRAGYATAVDYSDKLIELMTMYDLYQFDHGGMVNGNGIAKGNFVWPTVSNSVITSQFGDRSDDPDLPAGASSFHEGIDIAAYSGAAIYAADGGKVTFAGSSGGYGNTITIDHGKGVTTKYSHLQNGGILVRNGQKVSRGQRIGLMGSTGISGGVHLDFRIFVNGKAKNPLDYVRKP